MYANSSVKKFNNNIDVFKKQNVLYQILSFQLL